MDITQKIETLYKYLLMMFTSIKVYIFSYTLLIFITLLNIYNFQEFDDQIGQLNGRYIVVGISIILVLYFINILFNFKRLSSFNQIEIASYFFLTGIVTLVSIYLRYSHNHKLNIALINKLLFLVDLLGIGLLLLGLFYIVKYKLLNKIINKTYLRHAISYLSPAIVLIIQIYIINPSSFNRYLKNTSPTKEIINIIKAGPIIREKNKIYNLKYMITL